MPTKPLPVSKLRRVCQPAALKFKTTDDLPLVDDIIGQPRALRAIDFGLGVRGPGFNIFVLGYGGTGRMTTAERVVVEHAAEQPTPGEWVYVHNFKDPLRPRAMCLPAGRGRPFKQDMAGLVSFLQIDLRRTFEGDVYQRAAAQVMRDLDNQRTTLWQEFDQRARPQGFALAQSEQQGLFITPLGPKGEAATAEEIAALSDEQRAALEQAQPAVEDDFNAMLRRVHELDLEAREKIQELDRQTATKAVDPRIDQLIARYQPDCPEVADYLEEAHVDIVTHAADFRDGSIEQADAASDQPPVDPLLRFQVNVLVDHSLTHGAPVVFETNPTFMNLMGRIERDVQLGENVLDFTMLRAGALHRANGGYLVLRAADVLKDVNAWDALKRALLTGQIVIEDPGTHLQMFSTRTLESEPIPLDVKVMLLGTPHLYYDLYQYDEEFARLFKVKAEFASDMTRTTESEQAYALFVRARCAEHHLPPFDAGAVAQIVEHGSRAVEDQTKLSTQFGDIADLIVEAAHWARKANRATVSAADVRRALAEWRYRSNLIEEETQQPITDGTIKIDVTGAVVGQINGLTVIEYGEYQFGHPSRISARIYVGRSGVMVIEREVHLSGRIHNKGVLTLEGYLHGQYATKEALSLAASLSFEQNYSEIEGDSASSTELYALLSALAELPIKQGVAVTGSVDQQGRVQPVGGVQYKIEGYFDICQARGLTGEQGVMIPASNIKNLMLREDVLAACREGKFHLWAVNTIDEGLELLTGVKAGRRSKRGAFTKDSVHARVAARLKLIAEQLDGGRKERDESDEEEKTKKQDEETKTRRKRKT
ncbi:MAG TPA: ATP-binding protein [Anaerolineae bacterium]|nr:ATP-binding protein [Anaerolineae bacterium]